MKLSAVEATVVYPRDGSGHGIPVIQIHTDKGLTGWGEAQASRVPEAVCDVVRNLLSPALRSRNFTGERAEIESIWNYMYTILRTEAESGGFTDTAIGGVDMALWDLAGKAQNRAVHQIVNRSSDAAEVEAFASLPCAEPAVLAKTIAPICDAGLDLFELTYNRSGEDLIAALDFLKSSLAENGRVAVNALWRLSPNWDFGLERQIDERAPLWLANPLPPEDPFAHGRMAKAMCTPLALGEAYHTHYELAPFFHQLAVGVLQPDLGRCGFTEALRMAALAKSHNIPVVVRVGDSLGPQLAAALQFATLAPGRRVEYSPTRLKTANGVLAAPIELQHGKYQVPAGPGLGIRLEEPEIHLMETQLI